MVTSYFDKECIRCHSVKHINEFCRNGKTNRTCRDCGGYNGKKVCPKCNVKKFMNEFQRNSQNQINCNTCAKNSEDLINNAFNEAFNLFNGNGKVNAHSDK
jgi:hypothetical protein